ncbi:MAG: glycine zipper 2TM domain-containing protein, partial [Betaproteobacteria bacterium]|nr:glycine zipper 2TM domain-containing protein [Betaproteobacteria bacterium]
MKSRLVVPVVLGLAASGAAAADFTDTAQVISATPVYERVSEPRQECSNEPSGAPQKPQERSVAAPILGGVTGAVLGRQVGGGSGRDAATAAGAVAGTVVGDRVANPDPNRSYTGAIVGGVAGAILGNQVGQGRGNAAATAAGAIAGAMIGDRIDNRQTAAAQPQPAQRCRTVETTREVLKGYSVVYRYNGRDITTTLPYDPGKTVRVGISVIDGGQGRAPGAATAPRDANVREVGQGNASSPAPAGASSIQSGGYNYRY